MQERIFTVSIGLASWLPTLSAQNAERTGHPVHDSLQRTNKPRLDDAGRGLLLFVPCSLLYDRIRGSWVARERTIRSMV